MDTVGCRILSTVLNLDNSCRNPISYNGRFLCWAQVAHHACAAEETLSTTRVLAHALDCADAAVLAITRLWNRIGVGRQCEEKPQSFRRRRARTSPPRPRSMGIHDDV